MPQALPDDEKQRILRYWWMTELFSPQKLPKVTSSATRAADRQVVEVKPDDPLPWEVLRPPPTLGTTRRVWQHTVYLGVYELDATYEHVHRAFGEDDEAYDERPAGRSACAGVLVDSTGRLVTGSAVLSSALWAVARLDTRSARERTWAEAFPHSAREFIESTDKHEGLRREDGLEHSPPPQDATSLQHLLRIAQEAAGITGMPGLATDVILVQSTAVSAQRADDATDVDFLNSFFLEDLAAVRAHVATSGRGGTALNSYLTSDGDLDARERVDVILTNEATDEGAGIDRLPKGRWPSDPRHGLALRQQFAVNQALHDLARTRGLMGVNGPPGTGKTTMLRDILAGNVVDRARRLATLTSPEDAFTSTTHRWTGGEGHRRTVRQLRPELTGFEMVVASANNAAVENVTAEIPARDAIHTQWHDEADYFADIATAILAESQTQHEDASSQTLAWGLVAARLGNKRNRSGFHSAFWFDKADPRTKERLPGSAPRMQTRLARWRDGLDPHRSWHESREDFARAEQRVDGLVARRRQAHDRLQSLSPTADDERLARAEVVRLRLVLQEQHDHHAAAEETAARARQELAGAAETRERHIGVKPGMLETILTFGRVLREWRVALAPLEERLQRAERSLREIEAETGVLNQQVARTRDDLTSAAVRQAQASEELSALRRRIAADEEELGKGYPGSSWSGETRELHAPWLDHELDAARSDLFLAALRLHQDFLANAAADMSHGLRAALEVVAGGGPRGLEPEKRRAAWQLFFLVVPLVSTTFASFGRMFGDIGAESIGWLLIDEAGQASPQYAAGAIWRAQRVVAVGDPLQLQPVVTIPRKAQRDIAVAYDVSDTWIPPQSSVQTLADRVARYGTTLRQGDHRRWVSAPLTVHRRCDDPMFALCNEIAYNGIMVNGVSRRLDDPDAPDLFDDVNGPLIAASHWVDEPALTKGNHLQENQISRMEKALTYLDNHGVAMDEVIAISPFRDVADRLETLSEAYPGLRAGTIHTAQGREAAVVFLVLGGDPDSPGSKAWAAATVNLVNVAASRAKRRLFVIGDRSSWARHNYFNQLAASLAGVEEQAGRT